MSLREPAWRVTTRELEVSLEEERGEGARVASYLLSPFGSRMNRVLITGSLSPPEPVGREEPPTFWRSRLADPVGAVSVTAGTFQPRAMAQLRRASSPRGAIVVGKVHLFRGRDGVGYVSVRAEGIRAVPEVEERSLLADVVRHTLDRLDLVERVEKEPATSDADLRAGGAPSAWIRAARLSVQKYPEVDRAAFRRELLAAVRRVAGDSGPRASGSPPPPTVTVTRVPPAAARAPSPTSGERSDESLFLDLVDEIAEGSIDGYADLKDVLERIATRGVAAPRAEAALNRLEEEGRLEEPIVGKLRRA